MQEDRIVEVDQTLITKYMKISLFISFVFGAINLTGMIGETKWYKILCFALLGGIPILTALKNLRKKDSLSLRGQSWINIIMGLSILTMATSSFYAADHLPFLNYVSAIGLILGGVFTLVKAIKVGKVEIVS